MLDANPLDIIIRIIYECVKCFSRTINFDEKCTNSNLHRCLVHVGKDFSIQFAKKKRKLFEYQCHTVDIDMR